MKRSHNISGTPLKRSKLFIMEEEELPVKGIKNLFSEITAKKYPTYGKDMGIQVQETFRSPN
jgi:hypothetical protein